MIRVVLADDHTLVRAGLRRLLESAPDLQVTAEAATAEDVVRVVLEHRPDVLLLDVQLPGRSGVEVAEALGHLQQLPPTLLLSAFSDAEALERGKRAGVLGYLLKDVSVDVLVEAVRAAAQGQAVSRPLLSDPARTRLARPDRAAIPPVPSLTAREREVLGLIASGHTTREVARSLRLSDGTVKNHLSNVLMKLEVRDRTQAVLRALELQLV